MQLLAEPVHFLARQVRVSQHHQSFWQVPGNFQQAGGIHPGTTVQQALRQEFTLELIPDAGGIPTRVKCMERLIGTAASEFTGTSQSGWDAAAAA